MRLKDRVVIVTGAGQGIGEAIVRKMAEEGAKVIVSDIREDTAIKVAEEIVRTGGMAISIRADVTNRDEAKALINNSLDKFGRLDILVNNAGIIRVGMMKDLKEEDWDEVIKVNLKGAYNCSQFAMEPMIRQMYGKIINIASTAYLGTIGQVNYAASKAGVIALAKSMALELAKYNINVNAVAPGFIDTDMTREIKPEIREKAISGIPLKRIGQPGDVANLVLFLASDESSYITGQVIRICGGSSIRGEF